MVAAVTARVVTYGRMIKFQHSIFALPFALSSAAIATRESPVTLFALFWIVVAMVGARSAAMGFNRLVDHEIDARNPRTASRELPAGKLARAEVWGFVLLSAGALVLAASRLNPLCLMLSPVALAIVCGYSYTKRFTALSHVVLGLSLAIAPVGAWLALTGSFALPPVVIGLAVLFWVAGFDIIYSCQDHAFDQAAGLHSLPARLGIRRALVLARVFHLIAVALLAALPQVAPLHPIYFAGLAGVAALLSWEHSLVRHDDLSRVDAAFFSVNGWVSVLYLASVVVASRLL